MAENTYKKVPLADIGEDDPIPSVKKYGWGVRHIQTFLLFLSFSVGYIARSHLGVTIVAMTIIPNVTVDESCNLLNVTENINDSLRSQNQRVTFSNDEGIINDTFEESTLSINRKYIWSKPIQEMALSSFFFGYFVAQFLMSMVAQRWGGKICLQIALSVNAIISFATPWLIYWGGWKAMCACRVAQGMSQAGMLPSIQLLLAEWIPFNERATVSSFVYTGSTFGTVLGFQLAGLLSDSFGWPAVFWGVGVICAATYISVAIFGSDTPYAHKFISEEERNYITHAAGSVSKQKPKLPWKAIWTSKYVWAIYATHCGSSIAFVFILIQVPTYVHYTLGVDVKNSGILSSLPYVASIFASILFGAVSDFLTNRNILSVMNGRRLFNCISQIGAASCIIAFSFTKDVGVAIFLLVTAMSCSSAFHVGWMVNYIDLSPNFAGTLSAIGNTFMNSLVLVVPVLVSFIVTDVTNQFQWRILFILTASFALVTNAIFVIFMSADKQPWNDVENEKPEIVMETSKEKELTDYHQEKM